MSATLKDRAHQRAVRFVSSRRRSRPMRALRRLAHAYLDLDGNRSYEPSMNGETRVLEVLTSVGARVLFDVGANAGEWTATAHRLMPGARIHAFEIIPDTAAQLRANLAGTDAVTVNELGLDAEAGTVEVRYYPDFSEGSGFALLDRDLPYELRTATVVTGDGYCAEHGIGHIDLLKIDVEGAEERVLRGFDRMLGDGAVDVVQFEYGRSNIASHFLLRDFHLWFADRGYQVGRVFPTHVDFAPYDPLYDEDFRGPNFVAVGPGRDALLAALAG